MHFEALITHSGRFHADEVLAYAVLSSLFPKARLLRSRDPGLIAQYAGRAVIFDVGHVFDPDTFLFDHHQVTKPRRPDGVAYSSFGLIWQHFGLSYLHQQIQGLPDEDAQALHARIDGRFVRSIDLTDNLEAALPGSSAFEVISMPLLIENLNPPEGAPQAEEDRLFLEAVSIAKRLFEAKVAQAARTIEAGKEIIRAISRRSNPAWIELKSMVPFDEAVLTHDRGEVLYVLAPGRDEWLVRAVSTQPGAAMPRKPFPAAWAGLQGRALQIASGVADARFCHTARFLAVAETRDGAIALMRQALAA